MAFAQKRTHARVSREERDTRPQAPGGWQSKTTCIHSSGPPRRPFQKNSDPTAPELRLPPGVNAAPELLPSPALETSSGVPALLRGAFIASVQHWVFGLSKGAGNTSREHHPGLTALPTVPD